MTMRSDNRLAVFGALLLSVAAGCARSTSTTSDLGTQLLKPDGSLPAPTFIVPAARVDDPDAGPNDGDDAGDSSCVTAKDCDDGSFCNGVERCEHARCLPALAEPCIRRSQCGELAQRCDCDFDEDGVLSARCGGDDCDEDHDKHTAIECHGDDCDDTDPHRYGGNAEVCDEAGLDEDCQLTTVAGPSREDDPVDFDAQRDRDGDGYLNPRCVNYERGSAEPHRDPLAQYDCDDDNPAVHPHAAESCDGLDNDCNGLIDEDESGVEYGQQQEFCYDHDGDNWGTQSKRVRACAPPRFYASCHFDTLNGSDCDDDDPNVVPTLNVLEICDGKDNDCDGKIDQEDRDIVPLADQLSSLGAGTDLSCVMGRWAITACPDGFKWCDPSTVVHGCEVDIRQLSSCRSCGATACQFACGTYGCDEVKSVSVGYEHACAVTQEGLAACWGNGAEGRLGNNGEVSSSVPVSVTGLSHVVELTAGPVHTCAIVGDDRAVYCWGSNGKNQLGSPERGKFNSTPVSVVGLTAARLTGAAHMALAAEHTCAALASGEVLCWGEQANGRLGSNAPDATGPGDPRRVRRIVASQVEFVNDAQTVLAGRLHTCLLTRSGDVECWGDNVDGQLGDPALTDAFVAYARAVPGVRGVTKLSVGDFHACALAHGQVLCWGLNDVGQLGRPSDERDAAAQPVPGLSQVVDIAAGASFTCALTASGQTSCWGDGTWLGLPDAGMMAQAIALVDASTLAAGGGACALDTASRVRCWGQNFFGQLGRGSTTVTPSSVPTQISALQRNYGR